jgi:hypothetical protein
MSAPLDANARMLYVQTKDICPTGRRGRGRTRSGCDAQARNPRTGPRHHVAGAPWHRRFEPWRQPAHGTGRDYTRPGRTGRAGHETGRKKRENNRASLPPRKGAALIPRRDREWRTRRVAGPEWARTETIAQQKSLPGARPSPKRSPHRHHNRPRWLSFKDTCMYTQLSARDAFGGRPRSLYDRFSDDHFEGDHFEGDRREAGTGTRAGAQPGIRPCRIRQQLTRKGDGRLRPPTSPSLRQHSHHPGATGPRGAKRRRLAVKRA